MDKRIITLKFTEAEANLMIDALGDRPYKVTANLISNLQKQYQDQIADAAIVKKQPSTSKRSNGVKK